MSSGHHEGSVRQLAPGKLNNIKKLFEDGDGKTEKPKPPARPLVPPSRVKSPVRQLQEQPKLSLPLSQKSKQGQKFSLASEAAAHPMQKRDHRDVGSQPVEAKKPSADHIPGPSVQERVSRKLSPTISRRIDSLIDKGSTPPTGDTKVKMQVALKNTSNNASSQPLEASTSGCRHTDNCPAPAVNVDNPLYGGFFNKNQASPNVSDMYSKVQKKPQQSVEETPKKVTFKAESSAIQRREAVRKNSGERRKTVACFESESVETENSGVSVALRTKMFDAQKTEKPALPKKPVAVKRHTSMRTSKEMEQQLNGEKPEIPFKAQSVSDTNSFEGTSKEIYEPPWDASQNPVVEKLKKMRPPSAALLPPSTSGTNNTVKTSQTPKPPIPSNPPRKTNASSGKAVTDCSNESVSLRPNIKKHTTTPSTPTKSAVMPPKKPPRTHAHDSYLMVKISQGQEMSHPANDEGRVTQKKVVQMTLSAPTAEEESVVECMSVKERLSKINQQSTKSPPQAPNVNDDHSIEMRHPPPSRPPPPKRRPNSGGSSTLSRPHNQPPLRPGEGPLIIPVMPRAHQRFGRQSSHSQDVRPRNPRDELPPQPGTENSHPLQRFPLRKSYSSECIHSSRGSSLNIEQDEADDTNWMTHSTYDSMYEAVIDPEGYAVPHEFMKLPGRRKNSTHNNDGMEGAHPSRFLTKIKGFADPNVRHEDVSPRWGFNTSTQDQTLDKVNKRKMSMVKQKINQAYSDLDFLARPLGEAAEEDWLVVGHSKPDQESVVDQSELKRRIEHCASVRLQSNKSIKRSKEYLSAIYPQLFEYCLVFGLRIISDSNGYEPYVIHKFPENVSSNLSVPSFCFPDAAIFKPGSVTSISESYSFVMTYADGSRVYGYCRRMQPNDSSLPEVICIISPIDAFNMYNQLLAEIESRRRVCSDLAWELIAASFGRPLPKPGKNCHIRTLDAGGEMETIFLNRSSDNRLENVNYESPLCYLGTDKLVKVFSSLLMERRIILCSANLSVLTQTVHALSALLYPFQWQHVYIPLLPSEMLDVVCAPMPFFVGVLSAFLPQVLQMELEEVMIVDLDRKNIVRSAGDESTILPRKVQRALKTAINMCKIDNEARNVQWLMVSEAFLRMFIETVGHFHNHIRTRPDGNRIFQKEGFILELVSKELRQFLEWFTETQMFEVFVVNHVEKAEWGTSDLFMQRLAEYKESKEESRRHKGLGAKVKNFGKAIKTKLQVT